MLSVKVTYFGVLFPIAEPNLKWYFGEKFLTKKTIYFKYLLLINHL